MRIRSTRGRRLRTRVAPRPFFRPGAHSTLTWCLLGASLLAAPAAGDEPALASEASRSPQLEPEAQTAEESPSDASWEERIVVTATRSDQKVGDIPLHLTVIDREEIELAPEIGLRELFLRVPTINMLSEQGTLAAGPRDGSIAFRGVGGSAQSRTLVLLDGLPVNDPYGSFISWSRIPKDMIDRIEVVPGAGGSWGNLALSGVLSLITVAPSDRAVSAKLKLAELDTYEATLAYSDLGEAWSGWISGNYFDSDGFVELAEPYRTLLDIGNTTGYETFTGKLSRTLSASTALYLSALSYEEDRQRGTPLAEDDSTEQLLSAALDLTASSGAAWQVRLFGRDLTLDEIGGQTDAQRETEILSDILDAPSEALGLGAVWTSSGRSRHAITSGADLHYTSVEATATSDPDPVELSEAVFSEGTQEFAGVFAQDLFEATPRITLLLGARFDVLSTTDGRKVTTDLETGQSEERILIDRNTDTTLNPSAGVVFQASDSARLRSSVYTGFRAPTSSELFVDSVGRNINASNPQLEPERLVGGEIGVDYTPSRRLTTRATAYWNEARDLIDRVAIGRGGPGGSVVEPCGFMPQGAICRQRQNLAKVRARGVEVEQSVLLPAHWRIELFGAFLESEVVENPANPALVGIKVLRTPEQAGTLSLAYDNPRLFSAVARATYVGERWNEGANENLLADHTLVDLSLARSLSARFGVFAGVTNLLDDDYVVNVDADGVYLGAPRMVHAGVRFRTR